LPVGDGPVSRAIWSRIIEYDEALAAGQPLNLHDDDSVRHLSPQAQVQVLDVLECLDLLDRVRSQRPGASGGVKIGPSRAAAERASDPAPPRLTIGRFEVLHEIGSGGHGVVFLANDPVLRRPVALKVPRPEFLFSKGMRRRFVAEAQAAAALDHPNVVRVLDAGLDGTVCYIAQELCTGPSLAALLQERPAEMKPEVAARIVMDLAKGLDHAHQHGILHRDLKPANVLLKPLNGDAATRPVGDNGSIVSCEELGTSFPYTPKLCDFGICKAFDDDDDRTVTRTGTVMGTAAYMAPEQATGKASVIGPESDVYGLGAILYEMLTGRPPIQGESQVDVLRRVVSEEPAPIRRTRLDVSSDLEAVCLKCLEKNPAHRYGTAADLARDLLRFLNGEAVRARPAGRLRRLARKMGKQRRPIKVLLAVALSGWIVSLAAVWFEFGVSKGGPKRSEALPPVDREGEYIADLRAAYNLWHENAERLRDNPNAGEEMATLLARHIPSQGAPDRRGFEWHYLWRLCHPAKAIGPLPRVASLHGHTADAYFVSFSRDGSRIASGSRDRTARIWDAVTGREICVCSGHTNDVNWVDFSPDQTLLATASEDQTVKIWDAATGKERLTLKGHESEVIGVLFNPAGNRLVSGDGRGVLKLWDISTKQQIKSVAAHSKRIQSLAWAADGRLLATAGDDELVRLWAMPEMTLRGEQRVSAAHATAFSRDGELLAGGGLGTITVYDVRTGGRRTAFSRHRDHIESVRFSPDGQQIASCAGDGMLRLWDFPSRKGWAAAPEREFPGTNGEHRYVGLWCVAYSVDGTRIATSARDGVVDIWDASVTPQWTLVAKNRPLNKARCIAFSPKGNLMAIAHFGLKPEDGGVQIWDVSSLHPSIRHDVRGVSARSLCFSRDGRELIIGSARKIEILDAETAKRRLEISLPSNVTAFNVAFDSLGSLLVLEGSSPSNERSVHIYDARTGTRGRTIGETFSSTDAFSREDVSVSPGGDLLTICRPTNPPQVALYELPTGHLRTKPIGRRGCTDHVAFAPHEPLLALGAEGGVELWETTTGREIAFLPGMSHDTGPLEFSADGRLLIVVSREQGAVHIWHVGRRKRLFALPLPPDLASRAQHWLLAVSPDGQKIACSLMDADDNGGIYLFSGLPTVPN
jgi:WD40 repeat protein